MLSSTSRITRRAASLAVAFLSIGIMGALSACSDGTASGSGKISLLLTDAPGDVKAAVVTISQIYLQGSSGRVVLRDTPVTTDLLTLAGTTAQLVDGAVVPSGNYSQLRFVVTGAYIQVENSDGSTSIYASSPNYAGLPQGAQVAGVLQMPSFGESGLKVDLPGGAVAINGDQKVLLVDFNVSQSFGHDAGASGQWVMHPVVKATDFQATGSVTVQLQKDPSLTMPTVGSSPLSLGDFRAVLTAPDATTHQVVLTDANNDGVFEAQFPFLAPGTFTVDFTTPSGVSFTTTPSHPATVTVSTGQDATVSFTLTGATVTP
jgi:hypothetical protein